MTEENEYQQHKEELEHEEEGHLCHDCALDQTAYVLMLTAYDLLSGLDQPNDKEHMVEALTRATQKANWLDEEDMAEVEETYQEKQSLWNGVKPNNS
jgi:hypothetical protein